MFMFKCLLYNKMFIFYMNVYFTLNNDKIAIIVDKNNFNNLCQS